MPLIPKSQQHWDLCPCSISLSKTKQSKWPIYFILLFFACGDAFLFLILDVGMHAAYCMASQRRKKKKTKKARWSAAMVRLLPLWELGNKLPSEMAPHQIIGFYCALNVQIWASSVRKSCAPQLLLFKSYLSFDITKQQVYIPTQLSFPRCQREEAGLDILVRDEQQPRRLYHQWTFIGP